MKFEAVRKINEVELAMAYKGLEDLFYFNCLKGGVDAYRDRPDRSD